MKQIQINLNKRIKIISLITLILFSILGIRLAILTIAKGSYYKEISENSRIKDIYITGPRGEIRDRNGILLAGNRPMFTLQILKDEFKGLKADEKNYYILKTISLLEKDAITYNNDFPISIYDFKYMDTSDYFKTDLSPEDRVINLILENNLLADVIDKYFYNKSSENEFYYFPVQNIINSLEFNSKVVPINYKIVDQQIVYSFNEGIELSSWYRENQIDPGTDAKSSLLTMVGANKTILKKMLASPINRQIVYNVLVEKGLNENIVLDKFSITYKNSFENLKRTLMDSYDQVTMETTAEQDFIILFEANSLKNFLKHPVVENEFNIAKSLKEIFDAEKSEIVFSYEIKDEAPVYKLTNDENVDEIIVIDRIYQEIVEKALLKQLFKDENILKYAQKQLINDGVNSGISIANGFEYVALNNLNAFYKKFALSEDSTNDEIFDKIRDYYSLAEDLSLPEIYGILNVYNELDKHGNLAYLPVNFSYGLKNNTVAKIEESLADFDGFKVSLEPVRYYPNGETASHILGYMGKISQAGEIEEYVNKQKYNPDTLIGKTGIEESFQKNLYGENGYKRVEVDTYGNTTNVLEEIKPKPGDNIYLSIDYKLQKRAEYALDTILKKIRQGGTVHSTWGDYDVVWSSDKRKPYTNATSGAVMAVDVNTGEVLAMASYPQYDPNLFATGISAADWDGLIPEDQNNPLAPRPLYNVATQTSIQPGSTFKMITGLAGLEKGLSPKLKIDDRGYIEIGNTTFGCWLWNQSRQMHGPLNIVEAIRDSCNYFFYTLALGKNQQTGEQIGVQLSIEDISKMAEKFGLGSKTGIEINIPQESANGVPKPASKIQNGKDSLRSWLERNIDKFYYGEEDFKGNLRQATIDKIISWVDLEEELSLKEVYDNLAKLNLDGTRRVSEETKDTLADIIKFTYLKSSRWTIADTINITIGQGQNSYTLAQMTNYVASIANNGYKNKLTLINNIKNSDNSIVQYTSESTRERIELNNYDNLSYLREGMRLAAISGLNKPVFEEFPVKVALKTGTAERSGFNPVTKEKYDSFAYEVAFAPYDNPRIAVGVVIFQGGSGANCSPIVREVIAEYMGLYRQEESDTIPIDMNVIP